MVDAADLKFASRKGVGVRVPSWAPSHPDLYLTHLLQGVKIDPSGGKRGGKRW